MKYIVFILFQVTLFFISCNIDFDEYLPSDADKKSDFAYEISKLEDSEYYTGHKFDEAFLFLNFGMDKKEVNKKLKGHEKKYAIKNVREQFGIVGASYEMQYKEQSNVGDIYCFFKNDRLYEVQVDTLNCLGTNMLKLMLDKYGPCDLMANYETYNEYHWINGNRHISVFELADTNQLFIKYIDTSVALEEKNQELLNFFGLSENSVS